MNPWRTDYFRHPLQNEKSFSFVNQGHPALCCWLTSKSESSWPSVLSAGISGYTTRPSFGQKKRRCCLHFTGQWVSHTEHLLTERSIPWRSCIEFLWCVCLACLEPRIMLTSWTHQTHPVCHSLHHYHEPETDSCPVFCNTWSGVAINFFHLLYCPSFTALIFKTKTECFIQDPVSGSYFVCMY